MDHLEITEKRLGLDREMVVPMDVVRGSNFTQGLIISGAILSNERSVLSGGGRLFAVTTSSPVRIRPLNIDIFNNEAGWLELEFRDGGETGARVLGPYQIPGRNERQIQVDQLQGRYFTSSIHVVVLSGWVAQPLSNDGVKINIGFLREPTDVYR